MHIHFGHLLSANFIVHSTKSRKCTCNVQQHKEHYKQIIKSAYDNLDRLLCLNWVAPNT